MLIIPEDILFKHMMTNNVQYGGFLIIKWEEFPVLIDLIGLITSADFNRFQNLSRFPALDLIQFICIIITITKALKTRENLFPAVVT